MQKHRRREITKLIILIVIEINGTEMLTIAQRLY